MTANRTNDVGRAFLRWLEVHAEARPNPDHFLDEHPAIDGQPITEAELTRAVLRTEHHGMVRGAHAMGRDMPFRVRLLPPGQECLDDSGGYMDRWSEAQRKASTVTNDYSLRVTARDNVEVVAHARDVMQNMTVGSMNTEQLRDVGKAAQEIAEILPRPVRDDVIQAGKDLLAAADDPDDPDDLEEARSAGRRLLDLLSASSASIAVVRFVLDALGVALGGHS